MSSSVFISNGIKKSVVDWTVASLRSRLSYAAPENVFCFIASGTPMPPFEQVFPDFRASLTRESALPECGYPSVLENPHKFLERPYGKESQGRQTGATTFVPCAGAPL